MQIGNNEILRNMGAMTRDAIADATSFIIPDVIELPDTDCFLASIVDRNLLSGLLSSAAERNRGIDAFTPAIFQTLKRNAYNSAETLEKIRVFQTEENEEIAARLAFIRYDQALTTLKDAKKSLEENIDGANRSTWANFRDMFIREGFTESGGNFVKNTTVGATLMDSLTEKHVIEGYRYFKTTVKDFTQGIMTPEEIDLESIGATGIQALLDQAMGAVDEESKRIFGSSEDTTYEKDSLYKDTYQVKKYRLGSEAGERIEYMVDKVRYLPQTETVTQDDYDKYMKKLANLSDEQRSDLGQQIQYREVKSGEFNKWIGYAPVFLDDADPGRDLDEYWKNVRFAGSGETGRIMGLFTQHKMIEGSGRAEANMPAYSRRLWDDRGSFMPAPTIRTLVDIAVTIAVSCVTGPGGGLLMNALISTAFNMIDDAVFALLDMANGMDPMDVAEGFAKKAATSFASSAISGAFNGVVPQGGGAPTGGLLQKMNLTDSVIGSTMLKGTEIMATNVASSAINSFSLRGLVSGGDAFDEDAFGRGAFGRDAMAGVVAGMAGNAVTVGMRTTVGSMDFKKFNVSTGDIDFNQINKLGALAGSAASAMVQYGMTGETTVNVLNAHTLAGLFGVDLKNKNNDAVTTGLFGLTFGKDGVHGSITMSGYAMDVADIMAGMKAFDDISARNDLQRDVNNAARERDRIKNITDRVIAIGEVSYEGNTDQASSLLAQLQGVRSLQSKDNLHSMFQNKAENGYSESRLDENLDLAFKQHDISVTEFMNSAEFDTVGSFKHAMTFYNRSFGASKAGSAAIKQLGYNVTLQDMFSTGKAYAGNEYAESDTLKNRVGLYEAGLKAELGAKVYADAEKIGGGDIFKGSTHIERRILENGDQLRMAYETSGKDIALVEKTYQSMVKVDDIAGKLDNGGTDYNAMQFGVAKNDYISNLKELIKTDIFDGLTFDVQEGLNGAPMKNAKLTGRYENRLILPGMSRYPENYYKWSFHTGIDVSSTSYDPTFYSSFGGTLDITGWDNARGFGISLRENGSIDGLDYFHSAKGSLDIFTKAYLTGKGTVPGGVAIGTTGGGFYGIGDAPHLHIEGVKEGERVSPFEYIPNTSFVKEDLYSQELSGYPTDNLPSYTDTSILQGVLHTGLSNFQNYTQLHLGTQCNSMEDVYYWFYLQAAHNRQQEE